LGGIGVNPYLHMFMFEGGDSLHGPSNSHDVCYGNTYGLRPTRR
jgi:hypothetical protein